MACAHKTSSSQLAFYMKILSIDPIYLSYGNDFERVVALVIQNENEEKCLIPSLNLADFTFALSASSSLNLECRFCTFTELNKMGI